MPEPPLTPCRSVFRRLTLSDPVALLAWIEAGTLKESDLTFAAECAGRIPKDSLGGEVARVLLPLCGHPAAHVREGTIYGLADYGDVPAVREAMTALAASDPSQAIRMVAADVLEEWDET